MKNPEFLHLFTLETHYDDPWESVLQQAKQEAAHEAKRQTGLCEWAPDWVVICTDISECAYVFEVHGYYKYITPPEHFM